jgi:NitT/TauT family transport system permease protein
VAKAYQFAWFLRIRHIVVPQLAPYLAASSRSGLSIVWKIVLVVELIGRPNGVGFVLGSAFSLFDMARILSYAISFIVLMLVIESLVVQPLERRANRWRRQPA